MSRIASEAATRVKTGGDSTAVRADGDSTSSSSSGYSAPEQDTEVDYLKWVSEKRWGGEIGFGTCIKIGSFFDFFLKESSASANNRAEEYYRLFQIFLRRPGKVLIANVTGKAYYICLRNAGLGRCVSCWGCCCCGEGDQFAGSFHLLWYTVLWLHKLSIGWDPPGSSTLIQFSFCLTWALWIHYGVGSHKSLHWFFVCGEAQTMELSKLLLLVVVVLVLLGRFFNSIFNSDFFFRDRGIF